MQYSPFLLVVFQKAYVCVCVCGRGGLTHPVQKQGVQNKEPEALLSHTFFVNIQCAGSYKLTSITTAICIQSVRISCF